MTETANGPGLNNVEEGTALEALHSALSWRARPKFYARVALGTARAYARFGQEIRSEGIIEASRTHQERMRHLSGTIVYLTLQENPDLFHPEFALEDVPAPKQEQ